MRQLIDSPDLARKLSQGARQTGQARFNIQRFVEDWNAAFATTLEMERRREEVRTPAVV